MEILPGKKWKKGGLSAETVSVDSINRHRY
jgi:hypothetical protein